MKYEIVLDVNRSSLYKLFMDSLLEDAKNSNPNIKRRDLKTGLSYKKNLKGMMKQSALVEVRIDELVEDEVYRASFKSAKGINSISYHLKDKGDSTLVEYEEDFKSDSKLVNLNYKLMNRFYKKRSIRRLEAMFRQMESYLIGER